jgi:hypothetical protein
MSDQEIFQFILDTKAQLAANGATIDSLRQLVYLLIAGAVAGIASVYGFIFSKYEKIRAEVKAAGNELSGKFETLINHNSEEFERFTDRLELIDRTNIEYDKLICEVINTLGHEKETRELEFKLCKERCDAIRCNQKG